LSHPASPRPHQHHRLPARRLYHCCRLLARCLHHRLLCRARPILLRRLRPWASSLVREKVSSGHPHATPPASMRARLLPLRSRRFPPPLGHRFKIRSGMQP
jgi:hypothetical protein